MAQNEAKNGGGNAVSTADQCKVKMLRMLGARDYAVHVMEERLARAGFSEEDISAVIEMGQKEHLLDDMRYAERYIASRRDLGWGRARIELELTKQHVDFSELPGYPESYFSSSDELERACALVRSHRTTAKDPRAAHYRYLRSKGFDHSTSMKALSEEGL